MQARLGPHGFGGFKDGRAKSRQQAQNPQQLPKIRFIYASRVKRTVVSTQHSTACGLVWSPA